MPSTRNVPITLRGLRQKGACKEARDYYSATWQEPPLLSVCLRQLLDDGYPSWAEWLLEHYSAPAWKVCEEALAAARKVCEEARAAALKVCEEALAAARKGCRAREAAWKVLEEAREAAWKVCEEARAAALKDAIAFVEASDA